MARGANGGGHSSAQVLMTKEMSLGELRAAQSPAMRKATKAVIDKIERQLILKSGEITEGVRTAQRAASFTATAAWVGGKKDVLKCKVSCRVRAPTEPDELIFHLSEDDRQLSLGLPPGYTEDDDKPSRKSDDEREDDRAEAHAEED